MLVIEWHLCLYLFFIFLCSQSNRVYSIQCCVDDVSCPMNPIDCPSNVCFKLVLNKATEERGCLSDLMKSLNYRDPGSGSGDDQCQQLDPPMEAMSLCKCTSDFCNGASTHVSFLWPVATVFFVHCFSSSFLL